MHDRTSPAGEKAVASEGLFSPRYQIILIISLVLLNIVNLTDRSLIGILGEAIKRDLKISDTELGFVAGAAFFVVYTLFSLPIARIADRGFRKAVIIGSILIWCSMTTLVGLTTTYWQLVLMRVGVAIGEAGVLPATQALLYSQVAAHRRGMAMSGLLLGGAAGVALAPLIGGLAHDQFGWRGAFMMIGPAGLLMIPILLLTIKDKGSRGAAQEAEKTREPEQERFTTLQATAHLARSRPYRLLWLASAFLFVAPAAYMAYAGPFFIRTFSISAGVAGQHIAVAFGVGSVCGVLLGGYVFDRFSKRFLGSGMAVPAVGAAIAAVIGALGWYSTSLNVSTACFGAALFFGALVSAPNFAASQALAPANIRSTSAAIFNFSSVLGGIVGPLGVGMISDHLAGSLGPESLRPALAIAASVQFIGALLMLRVAFLLRKD